MEDTLNVTCFMYSKTGIYNHPMYVDGECDFCLAGTYFTSFILQTVDTISCMIGYDVVAYEITNEWDVYCKLQHNNHSIVITFTIDSNPAPYKDDDELRGPSDEAHHEWFFHHVLINDHKEDNWIRASIYLKRLFAERFGKDPSKNY